MEISLTTNHLAEEAKRLRSPLSDPPNLTSHYTLVDHIADGGSSTVWSVRSKDNKLFACKIPYPDDEDFVLIESIYMKRISQYPNASPFLTFYGLYEHEGSPVMVTELFQGEELAGLSDKISQGLTAQLTNDEILHIAKCILEQVVYLNNIGMCHGDIHNSNILYDGNRAVLIDITGDYTDPNDIHPTMLMTTDEYLNKAVDSNPLIWKKDIFDIGIVLRELVVYDTNPILYHDFVSKSDKYKIVSGCSKLDMVVNSALQLDISQRSSAKRMLRYVDE